jgi:hypothetical protein
MLDEEHHERLRLQKAEANYKKKIRDLERQLKDKDAKLKKEVYLRHAAESQLRGSDIHASHFREEVIELRVQLKEKLTFLPECSECDRLMNQCQYLKTLIPEGRLP